MITPIACVPTANGLVSYLVSFGVFVLEMSDHLSLRVECSSVIDLG